jgi:hypothetical protein
VIGGRALALAGRRNWPYLDKVNLRTAATPVLRLAQRVFPQKWHPLLRSEYASLGHDPEKWVPVFRKDHAQTKR